MDLVIPRHVKAIVEGGTTCGTCRHAKVDRDRTLVCAAHPPHVNVLLVPVSEPVVKMQGRQQLQGFGPQVFAAMPPIEAESISCGEYVSKVAP